MEQKFLPVHSQSAGSTFLVADLIQGNLRGQTKINLDLHVSGELERVAAETCEKYCDGVVGDGHF